MFQAYIDESVSDLAQGKGLFLMGGYVATAENWAKFSDEWQRLLDQRSPHYRSLEYFHLNEMHSDADQERVQWFYRVAEKYAHSAIIMVIDLHAVNSAFEDFSWSFLTKPEMLKNPYYIAFNSMLANMPSQMGQLGINSPIDFYFDETANKVSCIEGWEYMKSRANADVLPLIGETPAFRDDKKVLPLQAADLWCGLNRLWAETRKLRGYERWSPNVIPAEWRIEREYPVTFLFADERYMYARYKDQNRKMRKMAFGAKY